MKNIMKLGFVAALSMFMVGCASSRIVSQPGKITLENALKSVGQGLYEMKTAEKDVMTGLIPSEVTVTFNVTASGKDDGKLYVELSSIPVAGGAAKAGGEIGSTLSAERGNQITVKFTNLLLTDKDKLVFAKSPDEIQKLLDTLRKSNVPVFMAPTP